MASDDLPENLRCRFCLATEVNELIPVFCVASTQNMLISHMALACTGLAISSRDELPQYSCDECLAKLDMAYASWKRCRQSWGNFIRETSLSPEGEDYRCRICLEREVDELISLLCICDEQSMTISEILKRFAGLRVTEKDEFPQYICDVCLGQLIAGFNFRNLAWRSLEAIRDEGKDTDDSNEDVDSTNLDETEISVFIPKSTENKDPLKIEEPDVLQNQTNAVQQISKSASKIITPQHYRIPASVKAVLLKSNLTNAVQSSSQQKPQRTYFSGPKQFKRLTSQITKSVSKSGPIKTTTEASTTRLLSEYLTKALRNRPEVRRTTSLIPCKYVVTPSTAVESVVSHMGFAWAKIKQFYCNNCKRRYHASEIEKKCIRCYVLFDNFPSGKLQKLAKEQKYLGAYCCQKCTFFSNSFQSLSPHLEMHDEVTIGYPDGNTGNDESFCKQPKQHTPNQAPQSGPSDGVVQNISTVKPSICIKKRLLVKRPAISGSQLLTANQPPAKKQPIQVSNPTEQVATINANVVYTISDSDNEMETNQPSVNGDDSELETILTIEPTQIKPDLESAESEISVYFEVSSNEEFTGFADEELKRDQRLASTLFTFDSTQFVVLQQSTEYLVLFLTGVLCCGCLEIFETPKQLQIHRERLHSTIERRTAFDMCDNCKTVDSSALDHRMLSSKRIFYYCKQCSFLLIDELDFESHQNSMHTAKMKRLTTAPSDLLVWKRGIDSLLRTIENPTHSSIPFKSIHNEAIFHAVKETVDYKLLFMKGHLCCGCQHWYSSYDALKAHCDEAHGRECDADAFACELCHMDCKSPSRLIRHQLQQSRRLHYYCKLCHDFLIHHADDYRAHRAIAHNVPVKGGVYNNEDETREMLIFKNV